MRVEVGKQGLRVYDNSGKERSRAVDMKAAGAQVVMLIEELDRLRRYNAELREELEFFRHETATYYPPYPAEAREKDQTHGTRTD